MNLSTVLEITIGMVVLYYVLSLIVSSINSQIQTYTQQGAKKLRDGIEELLTDKAVRDEFWKSPLIKNLEQKRLKFFSRSEAAAKPLENSTTGPSPDVDFIPTATFANALLGVWESQGTTLPDVKKFLKTLGVPTGSISKTEDAAEDLEAWFNNKMLSVSSIYKQNAKRITVLLALIVTLVTGADTIEIINTLRSSAAVRAALIALQVEPETGVQSLVNQIEAVGLPILWQNGFPSEAGEIALKILGLLITWVAVTQGSAFWYQVLNKIRMGSSS